MRQMGFIDIAARILTPSTYPECFNRVEFRDHVSMAICTLEKFIITGHQWNSALVAIKAPTSETHDGSLLSLAVPI
jgi:hypothetical protein